SSCTGCTGDCQPEYCGRLSEWIGNLVQEDKKSEETDEIKADVEDEDEAEENEAKEDEAEENEAEEDEAEEEM
ncbi:MAG: hypothetical protein RBR63_02705, partial [Methanosarcina vacuolata]|nr:hypothetical protein [Methanosarcina vacuolata]